MAAPTIDLIGQWGGKLRPQNFTLRSGDDLNLRVTVWNLDGTKKDLTGATVNWAVSDGADTKFSKSTTTGIVLTTPTEGIMTISALAADSAALDGTFLHEAEMTDSDGAKVTVMEGLAIIPKDLIE